MGQYSTHLHGKIAKPMAEKLKVKLSTLQMLLNGLLIMPVAIIHQSQLLGDATTASFVGALGLGAAMYPFCYCIGWETADAMARTCAACGLILAGFVTTRIQGAGGQFLSPFGSSVSVLCGIGHFLALLIMSNEYYRSNTKSSYIKYNLSMLASLVVCQCVGRVHGLASLANTSTTFFVLWALEKSVELQHQLKFSGWFLVFGGSVSTYYAALWLHA